MNNRQLHPRVRSRRESGQALISTVIAISIVVLLLLTTITITQFSGKLINRQLTYQGQALNAAEAGVVETLSWFRRQSVQPVVTFAPALNLAATPPVNDTEDTTIGIVRTFDVSTAGHLKGRYEVPKGVSAAGTGVLDVSSQLGKATGAVWQIESTGYVWVENKSGTAYNVSPNAILSKQTVRTQIQRLTVNTPPAGLFVGCAGKIIVGSKAKIQGATGIGAAWPSSSGSCTAVTYTNSGTVTGQGGATNGATNTPYDIPGVFSVTQQELLGLADVSVTQVSDLPATLPAMSLIIINGDATFTASRPLVGSGILVVFGNLNITGASNSDYNGLVYCTGSFTMGEPSLVSGTVMVGKGNTSGTATIGSSTATDVAEIDYDPSILNQITQQMGQYRFARSMYWMGK